MTLFIGEGVFVTVWAEHVGVGALLPVGEPYVTLIFAIPAVALLLLRDQRRRLVRRHVRLEAETEALGRLGPLFTRVRDELATQLVVVSRELGNQPVVANRTMARAVRRLNDVNARLGTLVDGHVTVDQKRARLFLAYDTQLGATALVGIGVIASLAWAPVAAAYVDRAVALRNLTMAVSGLGVLGFLVKTWRTPSAWRSRVALLFTFAVALTVTSLDQLDFMRLHRPFTAFLGHKLLVVTLGITAASWSRMGLPLILATVVDALALYFLLGFDALKDRISVTEPWSTLVFAVVGLVALTMRDQRRVASLAVLREESAITALHRRATLLLALRDQLNSPLQTLVAGEARVALAAPQHDGARLHDGIARLVAVSRELAQIHVPSESQVTTLGERTLTEG
jgi:hypothetical protein